ncbi:hypothetical protein CMV30_16265 [Nibricoccus aquaticus]|uniref:Uncharacterized protein n=1 Tax=Nibricoccus aquaticus TaxID=2576891 RepID=A0A290QMJ0_9BACT|nr:hypothetical protein [Nibricoccus aquaticus]ATC65372.1 hypothetical protein CMV30_16265 [Nibricoccus aquaticus]
MKHQLIFVAAMMFSSTFAAEISLTDGRSFSNASIVSETPLTVVIKHTGGLTSVSKQQLPADLQRQHPINEAAAIDSEKKAAVAREAAIKVRQAEVEKSAKIRAQREADTASSVTAAKEDAAAQAARLALEKRRAQSALESYFLDKFSSSPGAERTVDVTIRDMRQSNGWPDRWVVTGSAVIRQYQPSSTPVNTTGMNAKQASRAEYRASKYAVETREFEADYTTGSSPPSLNVTMR